MKALRLLCTLLLAGGLALAAPPRSASADPADQELDEFVDEVVGDLDTFWATAFAEFGRAYTPPKFVKAPAHKRIRSKCGNSRGADHSYCPSDWTVFADYDSDDEESLVSLWDDERPLVIVGTLGHEWGHHVQWLLGLMTDDDEDEGEQSIATELQADCLMGVFVRAYADRSEWVERSDLRDLERDVKDSGDAKSLDRDEMSHGTGRERLGAYRAGYQAATLQGCGIE